uniref:Putative snare protein tlg2/syntaxin 16 n=1 Tax=Xenopsylla cheopis TaxID=163159 RepID=A0A6M2DVX2_XENCH
MTSRTLTDVFILMRNNAMQSKNIYSEQNVSDNQSLIRRKSRDPELGLELHVTRPPPEWLDKLEEAQYNITKIRSKLDELRNLHGIVLLRPGFEDDCPEESNIELLAIEITRLINGVHKYAQYIESCKNEGLNKENNLTSNVVLSLCSILQELSLEFHAEQNKYLNHLQSRNKRHESFFETPDFSKINDCSNVNESYFGSENISSLGEDNIDQAFGIPVNTRLSQQQLMLFEEENTQMAQQREKEVINIVQSISDLNIIFKDLAHMIRHQGTILDRIDYNIEQTQIQVSEGYKQLVKAETFHRRHTKIYCIMALASITITMLILLMIFKF